MCGKRVSAEDLAHAQTLLKRTNAIADTMARARHYGARAVDALAGFAKGPARAALTETVEFAIHRAY
jgi:octaprenyl-diphosphate synthase